MGGGVGCWEIASDGVYFYGEYYCWLPSELERALLASRVQVPPGELSECPFDHVCKISKYGFKINGLAAWVSL